MTDPRRERVAQEIEPWLEHHGPTDEDQQNKALEIADRILQIVEEGEPVAWAVFFRDRGTMPWRLDDLFDNEGAAEKRRAFIGRYEKTENVILPLYASSPITAEEHEP